MNKIEVREFGGPNVLNYVAFEDPRPGPDDVLVRIRSAGVNPADTYIRGGQYAFFTPELPYTPGFDAAGEIVEVGSAVTTASVGDRVFVAALGWDSSGAYAELMTCRSQAVRPLPEHLSFEQGAAIGVPCVTAYRALFQRGGARGGEAVLIHGASGGVGLPAVQMAAAQGLTVIGTASAPSGRQLVSDSGAHYVLDHSSPGYLDAIPELTNGRGVDLVIEMLADVNLSADVTVLAKYGRVVIVGSRGSLDFTPRSTMIAEADVRGMAVWNMSPADKDEALTSVSGMLDRQALCPVVGPTYPLRDASAAHERILSSHAAGKMVLIC